MCAILLAFKESFDPTAAYYFFSTVSQSLAAIVGVGAAFATIRIQNLMFEIRTRTERTVDVILDKFPKITEIPVVKASYDDLRSYEETFETLISVVLRAQQDALKDDEIIQCVDLVLDDKKNLLNRFRSEHEELLELRRSYNSLMTICFNTVRDGLILIGTSIAIILLVPYLGYAITYTLALLVLAGGMWFVYRRLLPMLTNALGSPRTTYKCD